MRTLLTNGSVYSPADPHATAIAFDNGMVTWLGDDTGAGSYADGADEVIDLDGKLVTPAFVEDHLFGAFELKKGGAAGFGLGHAFSHFGLGREIQIRGHLFRQVALDLGAFCQVPPKTKKW